MSDQIIASGLESFALSDIAHVEMGQSPDSRYVVEDPFQGLAFLQGNAEFGAVFPEPKFGCLRPAKMCKANDVLISVRAPVGAINLADRDYCIGRGLAAIRGRGIKPSLLGEVVARRSSALRRVAQGTTFEAISKNDLLSLTLNLPTRADWPQIAKILDTLDTAIHETEAIIAKLTAVKRGLLHDLLTRGIAANGELRSPQAEAPHLYKQSPLGWIPKEWMPVQIGKFASLQRGYDIVEARFRPGSYPVISSSGVIGHHAVATSRGPNVVVGRKGSIGTVHYVSTDFWAHDTSLFVTNFYDNDVKFVFHLFDHLRLGRYGTKSGSPSLNRNDVHPVWVGRPGRDEQVRIVAVAAEHEAVVDRTSLELTKFKQLKRSLMEDLLTGRVRVTPLLAEAAQRQGGA